MEFLHENPVKNQDGTNQSIVMHYQSSEAKTLFVRAHVHQYIELIYCDRGYHDILLGANHYEFGPGDMVLINSGEIHLIRGKSGADNISAYLVMRFEPEVLCSSLPSAFEMKYILPFTLNDADHQRVFRAEEISETLLPSLFRENLREYTEKKYGYELALRTNIGRIFLWILRYWNDRGINLNLSSGVNENLIKRCQKVIDYVAVNYRYDITAHEMAELCNLSYSYFSRLFKTIMKQSFTDYLNYVRLSAAETLLTTSDLSITEISMMVGFSNTSYFIRRFREAKHISPKQFRKSFLE